MRCRSAPAALFLFAAATGACVGGSVASPAPREPAMTTPEAWAKLRAALDLGDREGAGAALAALDDLLAAGPPLEPRREAARWRREFERRRFWGAHPVELELNLRPRSGGIGAAVDVELSITNLGASALVAPFSRRAWSDRLLGRTGEHGLLRLLVEVHDSDGGRSAFERSFGREIRVERDLRLPPGGRFSVRTRLEVPAAPGVLYRRLRVSAELRPLALAAEDTRPRLDALSFPRASLRLFPDRLRRVAAGGLALLEESLAGVEGSPEIVFVAALGVPAGELPRAVELLARAAPSLDPARARAALSALEELTGESFAADPAAALSWWEAEGRRLTADLLARRAGWRPGSRASALLVGEAP